MTDNWVDVEACALPGVERPLRVAEFDTLFADAVTGVERVGAARTLLTLDGPEGLRERVQELADRESECCSFFTFTVTGQASSAGGTCGSERVLLDIEVPATRHELLTVLTDRATVTAANGLRERCAKR